MPLNSPQRRLLSKRRGRCKCDAATKLDEFLKISGRKLLDHADTITHEQAVAKAERELAQFRTIAAAKPSPVEKDFEAAVKKLKQLQPSKPGKKKP